MIASVTIVAIATEIRYFSVIIAIVAKTKNASSKT